MSIIHILKNQLIKDESYITHRAVLCIAIILQIILMTITLGLNNMFIRVYADTNDTDIATRIENISNDLSDASTELQSIQEELESRIEYVENLKQEAEIAENILNLSEDQVNAVRAKLNQELEVSNNKSFVQSFILNAIFFILGIIITPLINLIISKFRKKDSTVSNTSALKGYSDEEIMMAIKILDAINNAQNDDT